MDDPNQQSVIEANVELHSHLAARYDAFEPHFRPENIAKVQSRLKALAEKTRARRLLDLGCGTGFMINIARSLVDHIDGVDVTAAMLERVDRSGPAEIQLHHMDTASFRPDKGSYDLVTAYSFLHHLFDPAPTIAVAAQALRPGGLFYIDLDPNRYFWDAVRRLDPEASYDPVIERELRQLEYEDDAMRSEYGVTREVFDRAEFGKNVRGGFTAEELTTWLQDAGFSQVEVFHHWFVGEGRLIHDDAIDPEVRMACAHATNDALQRALPLTRHLFKYLGVIATR